MKTTTIVKSHKRGGRIVKSHMRQSGGSGMGSRRKLRKGLSKKNVISDEGTRVSYATGVATGMGKKSLRPKNPMKSASLKAFIKQKFG